jgi:crotonobetainyl-CoA:carnitine CoA-transferase CaiB-like acyl-CoA transferase
MEMNREGMLSPYRVLDLTGEQGLLCGKILGDLGADVIKIEKPGGDETRSLGPFYHDEFEPEKSLYWFAYNTNKRGITLNLESSDGREIFAKLVKTSDIVIESFSPGYMDKIGLGYSDLNHINPRIILVSITPFGQTGPYKDYKISDIVAWAMGGYMLSVGDWDRPPVRISNHSQSFLHAGGQAAQGALMALYYREMTGEGQFVDVSIRDSIARCTPERVTESWDFNKRIVHRGGGGQQPTVRITRTWPCKDGYVSAFFWSGPDAMRWNSPLIRWMDHEGKADDFLKGINWAEFNLQTVTQDTYDKLAKSVGEFFKSHTKAELLQGALEFNAQLYPISTTEDIVANPQLASRGYWIQVEHPELGTSIKYPGAFAKTSEAPLKSPSRAPLIGEHNLEIYENELGIPRTELIRLKQAGVI